MRTYLFMVAIFLVAGCGRRPVPVFHALSVDSPSAERVWNRTEYARKHFVKASYDSSGITLLFGGMGTPEMVRISIRTSNIHFASFLIDGYSRLSPLSNKQEFSTPLPGIPEEHHKWTNNSDRCQLANAYAASLWLSWKCLGLDAPPEDGQVDIRVVGMKRDGLGVRLVTDKE